jgi:hypothetical protein
VALVKRYVLSLPMMSWMMLVLIGCAALGPSAPPKIQPPAPETAEYENGWWKASFQVRWPEDVEPSWWMDLFIAHAMLSPVLQQHRQDMILWRFHRRTSIQLPLLLLPGQGRTHLHIHPVQWEFGVHEKGR